MGKFLSSAFEARGGDAALEKRYATLKTLADRNNVPEDPPGFSLMGAFEKTAHFLSRPNYAIAGAFDVLAGNGRDGEWVVPRMFRELFGKGDREDFNQVMTQAGFGEGGKLSDVIGDTKLTARFDPTLRGTVGLAADIFLDPTTYIGIGALGKVNAIVRGSKVNLSKAGEAAMKHMAYALKGKQANLVGRISATRASKGAIDATARKAAGEEAEALWWKAVNSGDEKAIEAISRDIEMEYMERQGRAQVKKAAGARRVKILDEEIQKKAADRLGRVIDGTAKPEEVEAVLKAAGVSKVDDLINPNAVTYWIPGKGRVKLFDLPTKSGAAARGWVKLLESTTTTRKVLEAARKSNKATSEFVHNLFNVHSKDASELTEFTRLVQEHKDRASMRSGQLRAWLEEELVGPMPTQPDVRRAILHLIDNPNRANHDKAMRLALNAGLPRQRVLEIFQTVRHRLETDGLMDVGNKVLDAEAYAKYTGRYIPHQVLGFDTLDGAMMAEFDMLVKKAGGKKRGANIGLGRYNEHRYFDTLEELEPVLAEFNAKHGTNLRINDDIVQLVGMRAQASLEADSLKLMFDEVKRIYGRNRGLEARGLLNTLAADVKAALKPLIDENKLSDREIFIINDVLQRTATFADAGLQAIGLPAARNVEDAVAKGFMTAEQGDLYRYLSDIVGADADTKVEIYNMVRRVSASDLERMGITLPKGKSAIVAGSAKVGVAETAEGRVASTVIRFFEGHDATTIAKEWMRRGWKLLSTKDRQEYIDWFKTLPGQESREIAGNVIETAEEHFAQHGLEYLLYNRVAKSAPGGLKRFFGQSRESFREVIGTAKKFRKEAQAGKVPSGVQQIYDNAINAKAIDLDLDDLTDAQLNARFGSGEQFQLLEGASRADRQRWLDDTARTLAGSVVKLDLERTIGKTKKRRFKGTQQLVHEAGPKVGTIRGAEGLTAGGLRAVREKAARLALYGLHGRYWYEDTARAVAKIFGDDKDAADKFSALLAIYSPQRDVASNFDLAVRAWNEASSNAGKVTTGQDWQVKAVKKLFDGEDVFTGYKNRDKIGSFYRNMVAGLDEDLWVRQGTKAPGSDDVTVDIWMARAFGILDEKVPDASYDYVRQETRRMAQALNQLNDDAVGRDWTPMQVQAAIWVGAKMRSDAYKVFSKGTTEDAIRKLGYTYIDKETGKELFKSYPKLTKAQKKAVDELSYKMTARRQGGVKALERDVSDKMWDYAEVDSRSFLDSLMDNMSVMTYEAAPGVSLKSLWPGYAHATPSQRLELQMAVDNAIIGGESSYRDRLLEAFGMRSPHRSPFTAHYEDATDNVQTSVFGLSTMASADRLSKLPASVRRQHGAVVEEYYRKNYPKTLDPEDLLRERAYLAVIGDILGQDSVGHHRVFSTDPGAASRHNALRIDTPDGKPISSAQMEKINAAMKGVPGYIAPKAHGGHIIIPDLDNPGQYMERLENIINDLYEGATTTRQWAFSDLLERKDYGEYLKLIDSGAFGDDIKRVVSDVRKEVSAAREAIADKYGWKYRTHPAPARTGRKVKVYHIGKKAGLDDIDPRMMDTGAGIGGVAKRPHQMPISFWRRGAPQRETRLAGSVYATEIDEGLLLDLNKNAVHDSNIKRAKELQAGELDAVRPADWMRRGYVGYIMGDEVHLFVPTKATEIGQARALKAGHMVDYDDTISVAEAWTKGEYDREFHTLARGQQHSNEKIMAAIDDIRAGGEQFQLKVVDSVGTPSAAAKRAAIEAEFRGRPAVKKAARLGKEIGDLRQSAKEMRDLRDKQKAAKNAARQLKEARQKGTLLNARAAKQRAAAELAATRAQKNFASRARTAGAKLRRNRLRELNEKIQNALEWRDIDAPDDLRQQMDLFEEPVSPAELAARIEDIAAGVQPVRTAQEKAARKNALARMRRSIKKIRSEMTEQEAALVNARMSHVAAQDRYAAALRDIQDNQTVIRSLEADRKALLEAEREAHRLAQIPQARISALGGQISDLKKGQKKLTAKDISTVDEGTLRGLPQDAQAIVLYKMMQNVQSLEHMAAIINKYEDVLTKLDAAPLQKAKAAIDQFLSAPAYSPFGDKQIWQPFTLKAGDKVIDQFELPAAIARDLETWDTKYVMQPEVRGLLRLFDWGTNVFKASVTVPFPAFHFRNAYSNIFQIAADITLQAFNPVRHLEAMRIMGGADGTLRTATGARYTYEQIRQMAKTYQVHVDFRAMTDIIDGRLPHQFSKGNRLVKALRSVEDGGPLGKPGRWAAEKIETEARMLHFITNLRRGALPQDAAQQMKKFLFDYGNLSDFEKQWMRRIIPFYTWNSKNMRAQMYTVWHKPGVWNSLHKPFDNERGPEADMLPAYLRGDLKIKLEPGPGKAAAFLTGIDIPQQNIDVIFSGSLERTMRDNIGLLNPLLKAPMEFAMGMESFTGRPIHGAQQMHKLGPLLDRFPKQMKDYFELQKYEDSQGRTRYVANGTKVYLVFKSWALSRMMGTAAEFAKMTDQDDQVSDMMLKFMTGMSFREFDLTEAQKKMLTTRYYRLEDKLVKKGVRLKFETTYTRPDLKEQEQPKKQGKF